MRERHLENRRKSGILGLAGVILFVLAFVILGNLNSEFNFKEDFISKLGALGESNAIWWNLIGFVLVGSLQIGFGISYGKILKDKLAGFLLALFGVGLIFTSVPIDIGDSNTPISKVHIVAICFALAFWLFGLSRISYNTANKKSIRNRANIAAILIVTSMIGFVIGFWSMPITHRMVFIIVFGWTAITSIGLLISDKRQISSKH